MIHNNNKNYENTLWKWLPCETRDWTKKPWIGNFGVIHYAVTRYEIIWFFLEYFNTLPTKHTSDNNLPGKRLAFMSDVSKMKLWNVIYTCVFHSVTLSPSLRKGHHILVLCFILKNIFSLFCTEDGQTKVLTKIFA